MVRVVLCVLAVTSLGAVATLVCHPRLWLRCIGVLATPAFIGLYPFVRVALYKPSSFDANADGIGLLIEFVYVAAFAGIFHLGFFLILVGSVIEERKRSPRA
jgi:hypothetical protein